ncbi:hypothetical protein [Streptomyces sp. NPDC057340]
MGVSIARVSQVEHGEVATLDVIARYVGAVGGGAWAGSMAGLLRHPV